MDVFQANGFHFTDDPATGRLLLAAVPFRCVRRGAVLRLSSQHCSQHRSQHSSALPCSCPVSTYLSPPPPSPRCSKGLTFGASDVRELVTLLDSGAAAPYAVGCGAGGGSAAAGGGGQQVAQGAVVVRPSR